MTCREARQLRPPCGRLRPLLTYALPVVSVQTLLELARAYMALVDPSGARAVLEQAHNILRRGPTSAPCAAAVAQLRDPGRPDHRGRAGRCLLADGGRTAAGAVAADPPAVPEIAERLYVSRHTVKSQVGRSIASSVPPRARRRSTDQAEIGMRR